MTELEKRALQRRQGNLKSELSSLMPHLENPNVTDIMVNPDSSLWVKELGKRSRCHGTLDEDNIERIILFTASLLRQTVDYNTPEMDGVIPLNEFKARISAFVPPYTTGPTFAIRKFTGKIFTLNSYVKNDQMTEKQKTIIQNAAHTQKNIIISGGTGSGKTTLLNAVLNEVAKASPKERFYIVEDAPEIQVFADNIVSLVVPPNVTTHAVRKALRYFPDRIIFGELRYGSTAQELLKAWNTGHPGGLTTIHANSSHHVKTRLLGLLQEELSDQASAGLLIKDSIDCIVHMTRGARITEIKEFHKEGEQ